jgi:hypothetical protein
VHRERGAGIFFAIAGMLGYTRATMTLGTCLKRLSSVALLGFVLCPRSIHAQALRYDYHRNLTDGSMRYRESRAYNSMIGRRQDEKTPPDYATLRIGAFYSTAAFTQTAGYRYIRTQGEGVDFLYGNRRGRYLSDGSDFPLITTLDLRNYLLITEHMDLDLSVSATYAQYPLNTQEDEFYVDFVDEGFLGTLSFSVDLTEFLAAMVFDRFTYRTDYIDTRGLSDRYGGERYRYLSNEVGLTLDWRLSKDRTLAGMGSRADFIPQERAFNDQQHIAYREGLSYVEQVTAEMAVRAQAMYSQYEYTDSNRNRWNQADYTLTLDFGKGISDDSGLGLRLTEFTKARVGIGYSTGYSTSAGVQRSETDGQAQTTERTPEDTGAVATLTGFAELTTQLREDLSHTLSYRRGLRTGFKSDYELFTEYGYRLDWKGDISTASLYTRYYVVEPSDSRLSSYTDWMTGVSGSYPITRYAVLYGSSTYDVRHNKLSDSVDTVEAEYLNNYDTWATRIGTGFAVTKSITFDTYYEHIERLSDSAALQYARDVFEARFIYRHQF